MKDIGLFDQLTGLYQVGSASARRGEAFARTSVDCFFVCDEMIRHRRAQRPALLLRVMFKYHSSLLIVYVTYSFINFDP